MRRVIAFAVVTLCAAEARAEPPKTLYELSSPDVGEDWHLHAKDGSFVCALPCEATVGEHSGDYLVVHDDSKKVWRVNLPSSEDAAHVTMTARVGKGSPALGALGTAFAFTGAAAGLTGVGLLVASLFSLVTSGGCLDSNSVTCSGSSDSATYLGVSVPLIVAGGIFAVTGIYLSDHNKSASSHIVITPTSIAGRF